MKEDKIETKEEIKRAQPKEVGGVLRRRIGRSDVQESVKRIKFRHESMRFGNENAELLNFELLDAAIFL